jgi:ABC-type transport system involved in multi-copper enzyme maturation permease subunit
VRASLKAELRKLFSVRSTYIMLAIAFAIVIFFSFYVIGWRAQPSNLIDKNFLADNISDALMTVTFFVGLISILLVTHEYRYNTIMYSLTNTNSRSKVFYSKILVITGLSIVYTLIVASLVPLMIFLGIHAHGLKLVPQTFFFRDILWRCLFYGWGYSMAAIILAFIIRNQIATIVTLLLAPNIIDGVLSLLLKKSIVYLPFDALQSILGSGKDNFAGSQNSITPFHAALVVLGYLAFGWLVAWILFLRRDATTNS